MKKALICLSFILLPILIFGQKISPIKEFLRQIAYWDIIKINTPTKIFENWEIYENSQKNQYIKVDPEAFLLFPIEKEIIKIGEVEKTLKERQEMDFFLLGNSNLLDFLLKNPNKIPWEWKNEKIFFRGTLFQDKDDYLIIRYLFFDKEKKSWNWSWSYYEEDDYLLGKILLLK